MKFFVILSFICCCFTAYIQELPNDYEIQESSQDTFNNEPVITDWPLCNSLDAKDCVHYEEDEDKKVVLPHNQILGVLGSVAPKIVRGISKLDLGGMVNGIKTLFGRSTEKFAEHFGKDHHTSMEKSDKLYKMVHMMFSGMMKEEQKVHTQLFRNLEKTEKKENEILQDIMAHLDTSKNYQLIILIYQAGFYTLITFFAIFNFCRSIISN